MKSPLSLISRMLALATLGGFAKTSVTAQTINQNITLQPGWNAVWLEVEPEANQTNAVFENLPVSSVWTRLERTSSAEFIQSVSEAAFAKAGWQRWFPPSREESVLNNLFTVQANRAYLIKHSGDTPVVWNLTGRPSLRRPDWLPDSFTLRGAPVDPAAPPTFLDFFRHSPAHSTGGTGLQPIYRLNNTSGEWQQVQPSDLIQHGEAYWIFTNGASDYAAPLDVRVELGDGLDFGEELTVLNLRVRTMRPTPCNGLLSDTGTPSILSYQVLDPALGVQWPALPPHIQLPLSPGGEKRLRLAPRRQDLATALRQSVLELKDGAGTRILIPASVAKPVEAITGNPSAGLWVGVATLKAVSEVHGPNPTVPTATQSEMNLRVILHVDASGQTRLLKEVIQMWRDGTFAINELGEQVVEAPGEYVLLTDDSRIPLFKGSAIRDGEPVGRRVSTIGYDFATTPPSNALVLSGAFGSGQSLAGTLETPSSHPTNPFKHKYHPDHDNLNERFDGPAVEAYATARQITFDFTATPPDGSADPDFGYNEMGGNYREIITGIHKNPIHLSGTFRLTRVSLIAELDPGPTP
jgi:hypothetical protein